jgi:hypothetical protein
MQKLSGNTMDMLYKSCRVFTRNLTKMELYFYDFSMIFNRFYKNQQNWNHYLRN